MPTSDGGSEAAAMPCWPAMSGDPLRFAQPCTRQWFERTFQAPTLAQQRGWRAIASGESTLLLAPTGSGKTLAAFLVAIDRLNSAEKRGKTKRLSAAKLYWRRRVLSCASAALLAKPTLSLAARSWRAALIACLALQRGPQAPPRATFARRVNSRARGGRPLAKTVPPASYASRARRHHSRARAAIMPTKA